MMASGTTVANAFVQIMPSMEGATDSITNAILPSMTAGGNKAGATFGGAFSGKMGALLKGAGAAALGYLAFDTLRDSFVEVEAGFNNVVIATGATGEAAEQLKDVYLGVAGSVTGSFEDIGSAVGELNTRLGLNGEELEYAAEEMMKYAKITGQDATKATQDVASMMRNVGIPTEELADTLGKLTVAGQAAGIDVSNLANNVTKYNAVMQQLGLTTDEQIALMAQFEVSGADTASILNAMKKGVAEWAKEGKDARVEFENFVKGVQDGSVTAGDAVEIFGTKGGLSMYEAAQKGQLSFENMYDAISNASAENLDTVYKDTLTAQEKFDILGKKVQTGFYEIVEPIVDAIEPYMDDIIEAVSQAVDFIVEVAGPMIAQRVQEFIQFADTMVTTFGPVVEDIISFVQQMMDKFTEFSEFVDTTFGDIETAITTDLNDASTIGSNTVDAFVAAMNGDFDAAAQHAQVAFDTLSRNISSKLETAKAFVISAADTIGNILGFPGLGEKVSGVFNRVSEFMKNPLQSAADFISGIPDRIVGFFSGLGSRITSAIGSIHFPTPHISWDDVDVAGVMSMRLPIVKWYASGGFVDGATLIGAGEAGPEMILPKSGGLMTDFAEAVASADNDEELIKWLSRNLGAIIHDNAPTISRRDFDRMARGAIA